MDSAQEELGKAVAEYFRTRDCWPPTAILQRRFRGAGSVPRMAAEIGSALVICETPGSTNAVCRLTLSGLRYFGDPEKDVDACLAMLRLAAQKAIESDEVLSLSTRDLGAQLGLHLRQVKRVGSLLWGCGPIMQSGVGPDEQGMYTFSPSANAWYFEEVTSPEELKAAFERANDDALAVGRHLHPGRSIQPTTPPGLQPSGELLTPDAFSAIRVPALRELLERDAVELELARRAGAWKSVAFLAGSACEAVLIDLLKSGASDTVEQQLSANWVQRTGIEKLAKTASSLDLISDHALDIVKIVKKWRDLIHPWRASRSERPTREVANSLVALLDLLLAEARDHSRSETGLT